MKNVIIILLTILLNVNMMVAQEFWMDPNLTPCPSQFMDARDNNVYPAKRIGSQCWMTKNLAYLPSVSSAHSGSINSPYYYVYNFQGTNVTLARAMPNYQIYGVLYNWPAVMAGHSSSNNVPSGVQGVCPAGWHLPSDEEWKILEGYVDSQYGYPNSEWNNFFYRGYDAGEKLKEAGDVHWSFPNNANNTSGFTALPGGARYSNDDWTDGYFVYINVKGFFWSSTGSPYISTNRGLHYSSGKSERDGTNWNDAISCRCIKD